MYVFISQMFDGDKATSCSLVAMEAMYEVTRSHPPSSTKTAISVPSFNATLDTLEIFWQDTVFYILSLLSTLSTILHDALSQHSYPSIFLVLRIAGKTEGGCSNVSAVGFSWGQSSLSRPPGAKLQGFAGLTDFYPAYPLSSPSRCPDTDHNRLFRTTEFDSEV